MDQDRALTSSLLSASHYRGIFTWLRTINWMSKHLMTNKRDSYLICIGERRHFDALFAIDITTIFGILHSVHGVRGVSLY